MYRSVRVYLPVLLWLLVSTYAIFFSVASASGLQVASTVTLDGAPQIVEGMVIVADEESETYAVSSSASDTQVFGVTFAEPSLVFVTGDNQTPVVTEGVSFVRVVTENGTIGRGDLLVSSSVEGAAMRADEGDQNVFAIALESYQAQNPNQVGVIQAEIGTERARALQSTRTVSSLEEEEKALTPSIVRGTVAVVLVVGALFFILYSFRSTIAQGVVSVGRNPKARRSIVTLSFANIGFAVLLCGIVVFIAIAILILPL